MNYNNPRDWKCICNTNPLLTWSVRVLICRGMQQCCRPFMTRTKNTTTQDVPFNFTFHQMSNWSTFFYFDQGLFLSPVFIHQFNSSQVLFPCYLNVMACHLTTQIPQMQLRVNHIIILQIMSLLLSPFWLKKLTIMPIRKLKTVLQNCK